MAPLEPKIEVCIANFASRCDDNGVVAFVIVIVIAMAKAKTPAMGVQWSKTRGVKLENVLMTGNWGPWNGQSQQ